MAEATKAVTEEAEEVGGRGEAEEADGDEEAGTNNSKHKTEVEEIGGGGEAEDEGTEREATQGGGAKLEIGCGREETR